MNEDIDALNQQPSEKPSFREDGVLDVFDIWYTIQGEGPDAGTPAVFIRLAGCNLACPNCFGVSTHSKIPYLYRSNGPKVRLDHVEVGETILTFDEASSSLAETQITKTLVRTVKNWISITIGGKDYDVTPEHPFFTTRGLVVAADLEIGDNILEAKPEEIIAFKKMGDRNPMKISTIARKKANNTDYVAMGEKVSNTIQKKQQEGLYVPTFYLMSPEQQKEYRQKASAAKRREKNPNWKGLWPNLLDLQEALQNNQIKECQKCGKKKCRLLIHHLDENHDNDKKNNLAVWCHRCHNQYHQRGYNFWLGKPRTDGRKLLWTPEQKKQHNGQLVTRIERKVGKLLVKNISCSPYNTYLANRMWVHNCDADYTSKRKWMTEYDISSVIQQWLHPLPSKRLVVFTGGEPFRQNIQPVVDFLIGRDKCRIQVETNGTLPPGFARPYTQFSIVCSPKTPKVHPDIEYWAQTYKYVIEAGYVDQDGLPTRALGGMYPARPKKNFGGQIFIQPCDEKDPEKNKANVQAALDSCMKYGYRLSLQLHKLVGLE